MLRIVFLCLLAYGLTGCAGFMDFKKKEGQPADVVNLSLEQEFESLLAQPYIDPITRYLQRYQQDASRSEYLSQLNVERENRCQAIARGYQQQPKTAEVLRRFRAGYGFSCSDEVNRFAQQLTVPEYSDCYLLTELRNFNAAQAPCEQIAAQGDPQGQLNLALILQAQRNYQEARNWAELAAASLPEAHLLLGELYARGQGGTKDLVAARINYALAADQGVTQAQTALGLLFLWDDEDKDPQQARFWLLKAARQGNALAQYHLGEISEKGLAGQADPYEAMVWYDFASLQGNALARNRLRNLSLQVIDPEQLSLAQIWVRRQLQEND